MERVKNSKVHEIITLYSATDLGGAQGTHEPPQFWEAKYFSFTILFN